MKPKPVPKLLFLVTEDWYFCSHRLHIALAAKSAGYDVAVVTRLRKHRDVIEKFGIRVISFENNRGSMNPFGELLTLLRLIRIYRRERPAFVHHVAMKPILIGTIAACLANRPRILNALAGMGSFSLSQRKLDLVLKPIFRICVACLLRRGFVLVQNHDDEQLVVNLGICKENIFRIPGSGIDLDHFSYRPELPGTPVVLLTARLLWDKGLAEFVEAARQLRLKGISARFVIAGLADTANPRAVSDEDIAGWTASGWVEHLGFVEDTSDLLKQSHVVCLPSYREGIPKSLLEAASAGRPIVTTDTPGCREVVRDGENGFLVPVKDATALADALEKLILNPKLRERMGLQGRAIAEEKFGLETVAAQTLALYQRIFL